VRWSLEPSPWPNAPLRVGEYGRLQASCTTGLGGTESLQSKQTQGIWPIRRRWRGSTRCMGMVWERKGGRERERQLDRQAIGQSILQSSKACLEHGAASRQVERARERDCVFVFTALLERTVRAVRHASPDFPFPVARATRPFRFAALDLVSTTTSGRARAPVDTQTHRHSHVSPGCRPRVPFAAAAAAAAARRAACHCDCDCDSSGPHFGHASTLLACLARVVGRRRPSTVDCIVGMQPRPIEPAASLHGGMAASLHRCIHPSVRPRTTVAWLAFVDQRATEAIGIVHASTTWTAPCLSGYWPDHA
jgi:hypothetical protein